VTKTFEIRAGLCYTSDMGKLFRVASCVVMAIILGGSAGCSYHLGSVVPEDMRRIYVQSVVNRSTEPGLDSVMTSALRHEVQRDGTLRLSTETSAALELNVVMMGLDLDSIGYEMNDPTKPIEFRVTLVAEVVLTKMADGSVVYAGTQRGETTFAAPNDFVSGKLGALPAVCDDLALSIVNACVSAWW